MHTPLRGAIASTMTIRHIVFLVPPSHMLPLLNSTQHHRTVQRPNCSLSYNEVNMSENWPFLIFLVTHSVSPESVSL